MSELPQPIALSAAYGHLLTVLIHSPNVEAFLDEVARTAPQIVDPADACGITFGRDGDPFTVSTSHRWAAEIDELQYGSDEGPCLDAMRTGQVVIVDDLATDTRWDSYRPHAVAGGVASSLSCPLTVEERVVGAVNLYGTRPHAFTAVDRQHGEAFAAHAGSALTLALRQVRHAQLQAQLEQAMASRSVIDHAVGIIMAQQRCDAATAFDLLRAASQHRNRKLREVAAEIITNVSGQPPLPPPPFIDRGR